MSECIHEDILKQLCGAKLYLREDHSYEIQSQVTIIEPSIGRWYIVRRIPYQRIHLYSPAGE